MISAKTQEFEGGKIAGLMRVMQVPAMLLGLPSIEGSRIVPSRTIRLSDQARPIVSFPLGKYEA